MYRSEELIPSSLASIETLEEIIRNYQRNEQRLHELQRHVKHERKKAERLLHESYQSHEHTYEKKEPVEYFLSFENRKPSQSHRVRFDLPETDRARNTNDELSDLSRRCENLLSTLHFYRPRKTIFSAVPHHDQNDVTLQQALELSRPEFISHSRQRVEQIHQPLFNYAEMKRSTKDKYDQLPEVNDRLQRELFEEVKRRNYLRGKIFRHRLRQHVLLHGRTDIDESLTMMDT